MKVISASIVSLCLIAPIAAFSGPSSFAQRGATTRSVLIALNTVSMGDADTDKAAAADGSKKQVAGDNVMSSTSASDVSAAAGPTKEELDALWTQALTTDEVQLVRQELVAKYLQLGRSQEYAEREVDEFLSDRERSEKYLEMRAYAKGSAGSGFSTELVVQLGLAFFLGLGGNVAVKYWAAYRSAFPDGP
eukprot:CAMPEP_0196804924 /NCGR_PEP_ID=MMETSP1362-20130617/4625_1 /TAXON_ID=163516 /ORGANISM="Leptocylindrus danicus, Strain CCMP1856" /LENGTH=190 /DNA_ID=CAMNT_0042177517 /DNA_START=49 /DNA_END=621 /DNA_ORIENTATION=+